MNVPCPIFQVDAFTDAAFGGNPAAVCILSEACPESWMQSVAAEMNLSETAFLVASEESERFGLRWFTPKVEVALCGHATLASAHVLWDTGRVARGQTVRFETLSGVLTAGHRDGLIQLNFPAKPARQCEAPPGLLEALDVQASFVGRTAFDYLIEVPSAASVRGLQPDFVRLAQLPVRGIIVTARSDEPGFDFISRFFAPAAGVNEDPVTGSAHCSLGPHWQERLKRDSFTAWQASARGGTVHVRVDGGRVLLGGNAVTVLRGELL